MNENIIQDKQNITSIEQAAERLQLIKSAIHSAVIGQEQIVQEILLALVAAGHVLIEGVPGLGKTLIARAIASAINGKFSRLQFTPDMMPSDITGHSIFDMKTEEFKIHRGPVFCHILLADEINRAPAKTQSALLEVMQEQQVTIEGQSFILDNPFMVIATQNPIEQEGTYPLPEAQLDRFLLNVNINYPNQEEELGIVKQITNHSIGDKLNVSSVEQTINANEIINLQTLAANLTVDEQIINYAVNLVRTTRQWNGIEIGAGPRGSIALLRAARANALCNGNSFVTPDDIKSVAPAVLRHRLNLTADLEIEGYSNDDILKDILENVDVPRV